jgi:hypothetical protein
MDIISYIIDNINSRYFDISFFFLFLPISFSFLNLETFLKRGNSCLSLHLHTKTLSGRFVRKLPLISFSVTSQVSFGWDVNPNVSMCSFPVSLSRVWPSYLLLGRDKPSFCPPRAGQEKGHAVSMLSGPYLPVSLRSLSFESMLSLSTECFLIFCGTEAWIII